MGTSLGPFKTASDGEPAALDYEWKYGGFAYGVGAGYRGLNIPGAAKAEGTLELASGETFDFTGPWDYEDATFKQKEIGTTNILLTIRYHSGAYNDYMTSEDGDNDPTRAEAAALLSLSTDADQTCDLT